ncbi:MAG: hypothetical protein JNL01_09485 [Bdellovibrionales bacterium]|nr:hypothetical protein [Bdellovibrionales bacterium]
MKKMGFIALGLLALASACKLPADTKGKYSSADGKITMEIKGSKAKVTFADGHTLEAKATDLSVQILSEAKAGMYLQNSPTDENILEVFWVNPDRKTLQEQSDFVWMKSEVLIARLPKKVSKGKMQEVQILHCVDGQVLVDRPTGLYEGGCPQDTYPTLLSRVSKR